jgi:hypothetical protein
LTRHGIFTVGLEMASIKRFALPITVEADRPAAGAARFEHTPSTVLML